MRYPFSLGLAVGATMSVALVSLGVIANLWAFAAGLWVGWILIEVVAAAL